MPGERRPQSDRQAAQAAELAAASTAAWEALKSVQEAAWVRFDRTVQDGIRAQLGIYGEQTADVLDVIAMAGEQYLATVQAEQRIYMTVARAANRARGLHAP